MTIKPGDRVRFMFTAPQRGNAPRQTSQMTGIVREVTKVGGELRAIVITEPDSERRMVSVRKLTKITDNA